MNACHRWPDDSISMQQVQRLLSELENGTPTFVHFEKEGHPKSAAWQNAIKIIKLEIETDNTLSKRCLATMLNINNLMVHRILTKDLDRIWFKT